MNTRHDDIGAVIIGRNEGTRLARCIESVIGRVRMVVYVDSGSTDGSVSLARGLNAHAVELDTATPFTAARARNAGIDELRRLCPDVQYVQLVDGDCEVVDGWLDAAHEAIAADDEIAVVCGRRRERHPELSVYNRLIDMEWDTPIGSVEACGGDALMRLSALKQCGMFDAALIAGEEPELCLRLRRADRRIMRLDHDMTLHDANVTQFIQWWKRAVRCGHAYAEGRALHGASNERFRVDEVRSVLEWALLIPATAIGFAWWTWGLSLLLLGSYVMLIRRVRRYWIGRGYAPELATKNALFCTYGKFAELIGIGRYWWNRLWRRQSTLIEYKPAPEPGV